MLVSLGKRKVFMGGTPRRYPSERFPHKPHVPAKLAGARVVLSTPRKRRECSVNSLNLCVFAAFCLILSSQLPQLRICWTASQKLQLLYLYRGLELHSRQYIIFLYRYISQSRPYFGSLYIILFHIDQGWSVDTDSVWTPGYTRCVDACTPLPHFIFSATIAYLTYVPGLYFGLLSMFVPGRVTIRLVYGIDGLPLIYIYSG